jgi:hypothetical protein
VVFATYMGAEYSAAIELAEYGASSNLVILIISHYRPWPVHAIVYCIHSRPACVGLNAIVLDIACLDAAYGLPSVVI